MKARKKVINTGVTPSTDHAGDTDDKNNIRPLSLREYIGQERVKNEIAVYIQSSKIQGRPLGHVLLSGPPGLGKTTMARIIANELGAKITEVSGPSITMPGEVASILVNQTDGSVVFIDEIHSMDRTAMEMLYSAMEDYKINITVGNKESAGAKTVSIDTAKFTLIGATTKEGSLTRPLRDRFAIKEHMEYYSEEELSAIVKRAASCYDVSIDDDSCIVVAKMSRGTPRVANQILYRLANFSIAQNGSVIDADYARETIRGMGIDDEGLDVLDRRMLRTIINNFNGGPVGIDTLAASMEADVQTLEDAHEPYLLRTGYIERTPRGRIATDKAKKHVEKWSYIDGA